MLRIFIISTFLFGTNILCAQSPVGENDTILVGYAIVDNDTLPAFWIDDVIIRAKLPPALARARRKKRQRMTRLRYNVTKVYPYSVAAGYLKRDIDSAMQTIRSKPAKKQYKSRKERELMKDYEKQLKNLTMSQGKVLVKLIARETGEDCYTIVKDFKGGFNAKIWNSLAILFKNNLKNGYDPIETDADIEAIVREIEIYGRYAPKRK